MNRLLIVGAGTGDVNELTIGGIKAIEKADVVVADMLISEDVLSLVSESTELYVAKKKDRPQEGQREINDLVAKHLQDGKRVVRLKGGDPGVYGRLREEMDAALKIGFTADVIPGVSSIFAASAYMKVPLTSRGVADKFLVCSAIGAGGSFPSIPTHDATTTLVVLMGAKRMGTFIHRLIDAGYPPDLPFSAIEKMGTDHQKTYRGTIHKFVKEKIQAPAVLIIGHVAR